LLKIMASFVTEGFREETILKISGVGPMSHGIRSSSEKGRAEGSQADGSESRLSLIDRSTGEGSAKSLPKTKRRKRVGIVVVAYNAESTLTSTLDRIPLELRTRVDALLICDDSSQDKTHEIGLQYKESAPDLPIYVLRQEVNLGYGGNQKVGYRWAIEHDLDIVVLLHADGQYAPEMMANLIEPLENGEADAVFGSRLLEPGSALRGGMPIYKFLGNRLLTRLQNRIVGMSLSEWHSGYRAYSVDALKSVPFESNSDGFNFDTQIIIQLHEAGRRIVEIPTTTFYGDEICYVNGTRYAWDIIRDVIRYRAHKIGLGTGTTAFASPSYELKLEADSSHAMILQSLADRSPSTVLELGCQDGTLSANIRKLGHRVTGVDRGEDSGIEDSVDRFVSADPDAGIPMSVGDNFDVIVAADVLARVRRPERLLAEMDRCLEPRGVVIGAVPNFTHWYPRIRIALGLFDYDLRGILDARNCRFFTRRSFERMLGETHFEIASFEPIGLPVEAAGRGRTAPRPERGGRKPNLLRWLNRLSARVWPSMFAYEYVFELTTRTPRGVPG
jgi:glycosyltransferase involved in cell wall biosynthesis